MDSTEECRAKTTNRGVQSYIVQLFIMNIIERASIIILFPLRRTINSGGWIGRRAALLQPLNMRTGLPEHRADFPGEHPRLLKHHHPAGTFFDVMHLQEYISIQTGR